MNAAANVQYNDTVAMDTSSTSVETTVAAFLSQQSKVGQTEVHRM